MALDFKDLLSNSKLSKYIEDFESKEDRLKNYAELEFVITNIIREYLRGRTSPSMLDTSLVRYPTSTMMALPQRALMTMREPQYLSINSIRMSPSLTYLKWFQVFYSS